jgi:hypothetical protein
MKKQTKPIPIGGRVLDRWTNRSEAATEEARSGKPEGQVSPVAVIEASFSRIPNSLFEDASGKLWLGFTEHFELDPEGGFEAVDVETALAWLQYVSEFSDGAEFDVADICRIALAELARRPSDIDRVKHAIAEETKAGFKPSRARKEKRP